MRQGYPSVREWFLRTWGDTQGQQRQDLWSIATMIDLRIQELSHWGVDGLQWGLQRDDMLEGSLRQLAAANGYRLRKDSAMANSMLGFKLPGESVAPSWLRDAGLSYNKQVHQQRQCAGYTKPPPPKAQPPNPKGKRPRGKPRAIRRLD